MHSLFFYSLKKRVSHYKTELLFLVVGVIIAVYCMSVMFGLAVGQYQLSIGSNTHATLTVNPGSKTKQTISDFIEFLENEYGNNVRNVVFLTNISRERIQVGWYGIDAETWFPVTSGRFFTADEQDSGEPVVFLSDSLRKNSINSKFEMIGDRLFQIVGSGWIVPYTFTAAISSKSGINIIPPELTEQNLFFSIIPYKCYVDEFEPSQILVHFKSTSNEKLQKINLQLSAAFPDSEIYMPDYNSDDVLSESQVKYGLLGLILCAISGITIVQLMSEWFMLYHKELYVYTLCGMTRKRCVLLVYGHWFLIFSVAAIIAVLLHYFSFPLLKYVYANYPPRIVALLFILLVVFAVSGVYTYRKSFAIEG